MKTQIQHYYAEQKKIAELNKLFFELVHDPVNPMTNDDLKSLIKRHPSRYSRFAGYVDSPIFNKG